MVVGRNWKSASKRLAHLLAEKVLPEAVVLTAVGLWCFLVGGNVVNGNGILKWLRDSIGGL